MLISVTISLIVFLLHACTWEKMIFFKLRLLFAKQPSWIRKPLYDCPVCMVMWWGSTIVGLGILYSNWMISDLFHYILSLLCAGGINVLISLLLKEKLEGKCSCSV